jgi:putative membrane protein
MRVREIAAAGLLSSSLIAGCALTQQAMPSLMSDADIMSLFSTIDVLEMEGAQVARHKASSQPVRDYAERLLLEHGALLNEKQIIENGLHRKRETAAPITASLQASNQDMLKTLSKTSGLDFDRAYIDYQLTMHNKAIDIANSTAIDDVHLQQQLRDARLEFIGHAAKARSIREQLRLSLHRSGRER